MKELDQFGPENIIKDMTNAFKHLRSYYSAKSTEDRNYVKAGNHGQKPQDDKIQVNLRNNFQAITVFYGQKADFGGGELPDMKMCKQEAVLSIMMTTPSG